MICPNCQKEIPTDAVFCPYCGMTVAEEAPSVNIPTQRPDLDGTPKKRQTFLGVFSFILSLMCAWTTFLAVITERGILGPEMQTVGTMIHSPIGGMFSTAGVFFCAVTAILALFSLFGKNRKRGLGITALILSISCLLVLLVPFSCASDVSEQRPFETRIASAVSAASSGKTVQKAQAEADRAAAPAEKTEPEDPSEPEMGTVQIEREDVVFMLETTAQNAYRITIDNRSDRDVNFGWVSTAYALLTTDQGTYRCDIGESQFQPVGAYTQRTFAVSFDGAEGTPQSLELVQLYHLDRRGLPSLGSFEGICFPFDAQN